MNPAQTHYRINPPSSWSEIPWGEYYRTALERQLDPWWSKLFGYHLLKMGALSAQISTEKCAIAHQVSVGLQGDNLQVIADPYSLPFTGKSVDACLMAHTLSYSNDPHRLLREIDRILIDDGWLVVSGFNPMSLVGAGKLLPIRRKYPPYNSRMFSLIRIQDWLQLLNYEVLYRARFQLLPWSCKDGFLLARHMPALGCLSLIIARKRTVPLTLALMKAKSLRPCWHGVVGAAKSVHCP